MNGKPNYSDNGFASAAAGKGIREALREHLNVLMRDEALEIDRSHADLQAEINDLVADREQLEKEKLERQNRRDTVSDAVDEKAVELSKCRSELDTNVIPEDDQIQTLRDELDTLTTELEDKEIERAKTDTALQAPTAIELDPEGIRNVARWPDRIFTGFTTVFVLLMIAFLFVFYMSVAHIAFMGENAPIEDIDIEADSAFQEDSGLNTGAIVNPNAWQTFDPFVWSLPAIFIVLGISVRYYFERQETDKPWWIWAIIVITLFADIVLALQVSRKTHQVRVDAGYYPPDENGNFPEWSLLDPVVRWDIGLDLVSVLFLGFCVACLLGYALYRVMKMWNANPGREASEQMELLKKAEQSELQVQLKALDTEIQHLRTRRGGCQKKIDACIAEAQRPIHVDIARLKTEKEILESQRAALDKQVESFQMEINQCETKIEKLLSNQHKHVINVKKLEAAAYEFASGWYRFVVNRKTELSGDMPNQLEDIQKCVDETLDTYKASLTTV